MIGEILGWAISDARAQSYLDKFANTPAPPLTALPPRPRAVTPAPSQEAAPPPQDSDPGAADDPAPPPPEPTVPGDAQDEAPPADGRSEALTESPAELVPPPRVESAGPVTEPAPALAFEAGLNVASAYAYRGLNLFGQRQQDAAGLVSPLLAATSGGWRGGWFASFQATGAAKDALVHAGVGYEQNVFAEYARDLSDRVSVGAALTATAYPWARAAAAGTRVPVWVEPVASIEADVGVNLSAAVSHVQGLADALAEGSYTYAGVGVGRDVALSEGARMSVDANAGAKAWNTGAQGRANTFDVDLAWSAELLTGDLSVSPSAHLSWTNLPDESAGAETFVWVGVDTVLGLQGLR